MLRLFLYGPMATVAPWRSKAWAAVQCPTKASPTPGCQPEPPHSVGGPVLPACSRLLLGSPGDPSPPSVNLLLQWCLTRGAVESHRAARRRASDSADGMNDTMVRRCKDVRVAAMARAGRFSGRRGETRGERRATWRQGTGTEDGPRRNGWRVKPVGMPATDADSSAHLRRVDVRGRGRHRWRGWFGPSMSCSAATPCGECRSSPARTSPRSPGGHWPSTAAPTCGRCYLASWPPSWPGGRQDAPEELTGVLEGAAIRLALQDAESTRAGACCPPPWPA